MSEINLNRDIIIQGSYIFDRPTSKQIKDYRKK